VIFGGEGNDFIWGEPGDDFLYGDAGNDILIGNNGTDYFAFVVRAKRLYSHYLRIK
jgi:Ca2+-binding RTX toxin-like protein